MLRQWKAPFLFWCFIIDCDMRLLNLYAGLFLRDEMGLYLTRNFDSVATLGL